MSQRVNIQYSIDLEDIPKETKKMIEYSFMRLSELNDLCSKMNSDIDEKIDSENFYGVLSFIHEIRKSIADVDYRLGDCTKLVTAYQGYMTSQLLPDEADTPAEQPTQQPMPTVDVDELQSKISQLKNVVEMSEKNNE